MKEQKQPKKAVKKVLNRKQMAAVKGGRLCWNPTLGKWEEC